MTPTRPVAAAVTVGSFVAASATLRPLLDSVRPSWLAVAAAGGVSLALFGGVPWVLARRQGGVREVYAIRNDGSDLRLALVGWIATVLAISGLGAVHSAVTGAVPAGNATLGSDPHTGLAVAIVAVAVAPFVEELFFRGMLLDGLRRRWGTTAAVALSSLVFGALHLTAFDANGLFVVAATGILGLVAGLLRVRTGRLGPAITVHVLFNAGTTLALLAG